jgi:hypothetical protein
MSNSIPVLCGVIICAALASGQTKVSATGKCSPKPDVQQAVEVGDRADHSLVVQKNSCTWTVPMEMEGVKSKAYTVMVLSDSVGTKSASRGYVVVEMENGDKAFVRFQGTSKSKNGQPDSDEGTWSYTGGTGKLKGLTGKGTYKNVPGDGFSDLIEGEYGIAQKK